MMDMDFLPECGEMTLMTETGHTMVLRLSGSALRTHVGDSIRIVSVVGHRGLKMCVSPSFCRLPVNCAASGFFGASVQGGVVHGTVALVKERFFY
tara:strand:+ start:161 stop:445 length:285 start_codon:yes stop_codon:yes gene_type:complete